MIFGVSVEADVGGRAGRDSSRPDLAHRDVLIDDIVAQFFSRFGWVTAPILLLLLIIDVVIFRRAVKPVIAASRWRRRSDRRAPSLRLPEKNMPQEVLPLVHAVNQALDRLEAGFRGQREFTADAAHELRTPLAILRTQVDMIDDRELAESLRKDVENMSRLVNQLLEIAELDTFVIAGDEIADLGAIAAEVAAFIAPLALSRQRTVAVSGAHGRVLVRGNGDALARAVRNLVENALAHTPPGTSVEIEVDAAGALRVMDHGPGVPIAERDQIFRRFWRGDRRRSGSAGLGLSIVARTAEMHDATVGVGDRPGGGAVFTIRFPAVLKPAAGPRSSARGGPLTGYPRGTAEDFLDRTSASGNLPALHRASFCRTGVFFRSYPDESQSAPARSRCARKAGQWLLSNRPRKWRPRSTRQWRATLRWSAGDWASR